MSFPIERFEGSHYEVGFQTGKRFGGTVQWILNSHSELQQHLIPFFRSRTGKTVYTRFLNIHNQAFPDFMEELRGMANGSDCAFDELFIMNLRGEYVPHPEIFSEAGCSTCSTVTPGFAAIGHNEDAMAIFGEHIYFAHVSITGEPRFLSLSYPGFLFGNAMAWNSAGIFFTINILALKQPRMGFGRHFVARSVLRADSMKTAIETARCKNQSSGFNYTIASTDKRRIVNVETACDSAVVKEISRPYFHTNHYTELSGIDHLVTQSSTKRLDRGWELIQSNAPACEQNIWDILADQKDERYPICRVADDQSGTATLISLIFNLDTGKLWIREPASNSIQLIKGV